MQSCVISSKRTASVVLALLCWLGQPTLLHALLAGVGSIKSRWCGGVLCAGCASGPDRQGDVLQPAGRRAGKSTVPQALVPGCCVSESVTWISTRINLLMLW